MADDELTPIGLDPEGVPLYAPTAADDRWRAVLDELHDDGGGRLWQDADCFVGELLTFPDASARWARFVKAVAALVDQEERRDPGGRLRAANRAKYRTAS